MAEINIELLLEDHEDLTCRKVIKCIRSFSASWKRNFQEKLFMLTKGQLGKSNQFQVKSELSKTSSKVWIHPWSLSILRKECKWRIIPTQIINCQKLSFEHIILNNILYICRNVNGKLSIQNHQLSNSLELTFDLLQSLGPQQPFPGICTLIYIPFILCTLIYMPLNIHTT